MIDENTTEGLVESYLASLRRGEHVDADAFAAAHPRQADELKDLLPLLTEMEAYGKRRRRKPAGACTPPELPGSDYRLLREIGSGGMGTVWEAMQLSLNRKVAVKVLSTPTRKKAAWRERFARESRIVAQLHHPGIVKVYGAGTSGDLCYYAMELIAGTRFDRFKFPDARAVVRAVRQAALALDYAHRCGVEHRDVKPANLMIDSAGEVRVTDFGLASAQTDPSADEDARDGTLRYMAPERLMHGIGSFAADQYALGVTLWELLARKRVFADVSGTALFRRICTDRVPTLGCVDSDLAAVVAKSTARKAEDRYPDMAAFAKDLQCWLDHESVAAAPPSPGRRLRLWIRRKPATAALAAAVAACAIAFVAALVTGYVRTSAALGLAARNASLADAALWEVFHHVNAMPPLRRDAELLSVLLPYYGRVAGDSGLAPEKVAEANNVLGVCAFQSGDYALAEKAFRRLVELRPSAAAINRLADTLRRRGRAEEADGYSRRVADGYAEAPNPNDRYQAALALETLGRAHKLSADRKRAFAIATELCSSDPENPQFRFLSARLLAESPGLKSQKNAQATAKSAFVQLGELASEFPDTPEYGRALVTAMNRRIRSGSDLQAIDRSDVELALDTADRLLGRFPNVPDIVSTVVAFRDSYSFYLRKLGELSKANRENLRTTGMLELLAHNADSPDASRLSYSGPDGTVDYRQIVVGTVTDEPTTLVLALHDRSRNGNDNVRQMTSAFLRTLVTHAEQDGHMTVILLPQCPAGREGNWLGAKKGRRDGLLKAVARLVRDKTVEFRVSPEGTFAIGVDSGGDACWRLLADNPDLFARALVSGAVPVQPKDAEKIRSAVRIVVGEDDRQCPESAVRSAAARLGGENGHPVEIDLVRDASHRTLMDNPFGEEALDWLLGGAPSYPPMP